MRWMRLGAWLMILGSCVMSEPKPAPPFRRRDLIAIAVFLLVYRRELQDFDKWAKDTPPKQEKQ